MASSSALTRDAQPRQPVADHPRVSLPHAFRRTRLSVGGWAALLGSGAAAGLTVGLVGARARIRLDRLAVAAGVGGVAAVAFARVVDELRWRRSAVCIELAEPDAVLDLLQAVRAEGVQADMVRAAEGPDRSRGYALRYRARDDRRVRAVLAAQQS